MDVAYTTTALKQLRRLTPVVAKSIRAKIEQYARHPASLVHQVKKLKGQDFLRLRVGDDRIIFTADGIVMMIVKIGHRRDIYN